MADSKLIDLTADTTPTGDDLIYVVNDPGGTPADRKVSLTNLFATLGGAAARTCRVYRSAALSLANNGVTAVAWDAESWDTHTLHDNSTNPSRVTLNTVGYWRCTWGLAYASHATGIRDATLTLNGSSVSVRSEPSHASGTRYVVGSDMVQATAITDYVEVTPFQNSGTTLAFTVGSSSCFFAVEFIGA